MKLNLLSNLADVKASSCKILEEQQILGMLNRFVISLLRKNKVACNCSAESFSLDISYAFIV